MKVFWALIAVLVLGAAVMAIRSMGEPATTAGQSAQATREPDVAPPSPPPVTPAPEPAPAETPAAEVAEIADPPAPAAPEPAVAASAEPEEPALAAAETPLPAELESLVAEAIGGAEVAAAMPVAAPEPAAEAAPAAADAPTPLVVEQPDGSKLIAGRFILKGEGTKQKPYEVTWDMLVSAQETYKPRLGQKTIPPYLDMLHGKYVTISGFIAFPLMAQSADEMLVMLNQWDGCCIGIPPTPYDAVEVRLATAAEGETRFKATGTVTGKFAVDPYLVKDWLIGLYTMEDAVLMTD